MDNTPAINKGFRYRAIFEQRKINIIAFTRYDSAMTFCAIRVEVVGK
jgi:hypothetical protein